MTIKKAKELIKIILQKNHLNIMLHGSMGIGKSDCIKQIAQELNWKFSDIRLSMMMPSDLLGIPYPDKTHTKASWLYPNIFPPPKSKENYIILLDEIGLASASVQGASYRICLDRSLGEHYILPEGVRLIAATNKITDQSLVQRMSKALANRFVHFFIEPDLESWKEWAFRNNVNEMVIGFLTFKSNMLFRDPKSEEFAFCTPRSWTYLSRLLNFGITDQDALGGAVGESAASEFLAYTEIYAKLPDVNKILQGEKVLVPNEPSILYALSSSLVVKSNKKNIENIFKFCEQIPKEFHILTIRDIARKDEDIIRAYPKYTNWLDEFGKFYEDNNH